MISRIAMRVARQFIASRASDYADRLKSHAKGDPSTQRVMCEMWADPIREKLKNGEKLGNEQFFRDFFLDFSDFSDQEVQEFLNHLDPPKSAPTPSKSESKVDKRVEELRQNDEMAGGRYLSGLERDFFTLVEDPSDPIGGGEYDGWTPDEIRELYEKLYGEPLD